MDLTDKGAVEAAVAYDALLSFIVKLDILPDQALKWLNFRVHCTIIDTPIGPQKEFLHGALALIRQTKEL